MDKPFVIYRSSAGSGKTYTLALEYLKLALKHPSAYRSILAVTFTNKATREMKTRILSFLYSLSLKQNDLLATQICEATGLSKDKLPSQAALTLSYMLHGYSFVSVMTIDSFFQKVIRAFARELGLQAGFTLELDQEKVLDAVVDQLLSEISDDQHLTLRQWMTRFAEEKVEKGKVWDFRKDIKQLARELFTESYKLSQSDASKNKADAYRRYQVILKKLKSIVAKYENAFAMIGNNALAHMQKHNLTYTDFAYGKSGVGNYFVRMVDGGDYDPKKRGREAARDPEKWSTKKSTNKEQILEAVSDGLLDLLNQAINYYDQENTTYQTARQLLRFIYAHGILEDIGHKIDLYKQENDVMLISDAAQFLQQIIGHDDTPFIYEKTGSHFQHFLIDEFQDTSGLQWGNFRPLVENSLDSGHSNLVVGDVKQSIYRWRGGDWQLLLEKIEEDIATWRTEVKNLNQNYRSRPEIISFNNNLFDLLPKLINESIQDKIESSTLAPVDLPQLSQKANAITKAYHFAQQKTPKLSVQNDWQGYVELNLLNRAELDREGLDWKDEVQQRLPTLVEDLQDRGYQLRDIAFLVRDKRAGKKIVDTFMQYKSDGLAKTGYAYELISSESLYLNASTKIGLLIDTLRFIDNPDDSIAQAGILYKYNKLRQPKYSSDELHHYFDVVPSSSEPNTDLRIFLNKLPVVFNEKYLLLGKLPLYEVVESLIKIFELNYGEELVYIQAFQDAILNYSGMETGDLHSFLGWWDDKGQETSVQVSEDLDAMKILTIHKSKGLQFRVVLIPFCDWELDHRPTIEQIIWTQTDKQPFSDFGLMPMRYSSQLAQTIYSKDYYEEMIKAHIDNINLLYVAFTRSEDCLYAFAAPKVQKNGKSKPDRVANVLYHLATNELGSETRGGYWNEDENKFTQGIRPERLNKNEENNSELRPDPYPSYSWRNRISIKPLAGNFFDMKQNGSMEVNYAVVRRDVLSKLSHIDRLSSAMDKVYQERGLGKDDCNQVLTSIQSKLSEERLDTWFRDPNPKIGASLFGREGKQFQPDRIMLNGSTATVVSFSEDPNDSYCFAQLNGATKVLEQMGYAVESFLYDTHQMKAIANKTTEVEE